MEGAGWTSWRPATAPPNLSGRTRNLMAGKFGGKFGQHFGGKIICKFGGSFDILTGNSWGKLLADVLRVSGNVVIVLKFVKVPIN